MEEHYDIPLDNTVSGKIVNLNAITPRVTKYKSRNKGPDDQAHLPMVKMDHSNIYKENDILEEGLVEHIYNLNRDEKRHLAETGEQLEAIRKEVDVITKLQAAVNSRNAGEMFEKLHTRALRYGSSGEDHKGTKSQQRIEAERDRFSAKNLFNVRRPKTALGFETVTAKKFFTPPVVETEAAPEDVADHATEEVLEDKSVFMPELKPPPRAKSAKGYLQPTSASMRGFRPVTADVGLRREREPDDLLPPRAMTAVARSRSRRELELLSRIHLKEDQTIMTFDNRRLRKEIEKEDERKARLQNLRGQNFELQVKVRNFLRDLERFNKGRQNKQVLRKMEVHRIA